MVPFKMIHPIRVVIFFALLAFLPSSLHATEYYGGNLADSDSEPGWVKFWRPGQLGVVLWHRSQKDGQ